MFDKDDSHTFTNVKRITHKKPFLVYTDVENIDKYECNRCRFKKIDMDVFVNPTKDFVYKVLNLYLIRYRRVDVRPLKRIIDDVSYDTLLKKLGFTRLDRMYYKIVKEIITKTFTYYIEKYKNRLDSVIDKLSIFIYDMYIITLMLKHKDVVFILEKEHIKNIDFIFIYILQQ